MPVADPRMTYISMVISSSGSCPASKGRLAGALVCIPLYNEHVHAKA